MTFKDILSNLSYEEACKQLGTHGEKLLRLGGARDIDLDGQVTLDGMKLVVELGDATATITHNPSNRKRLRLGCTVCTGPCEHLGAAFSVILEEKLALGLAAPPSENIPMENLSEAELIDRALRERAERAAQEPMQIESMNAAVVWTDYTVTSLSSGKTYRVALRGWERGESFCTCPDFKTNTLGTCKHLMRTIDVAKQEFSMNVKQTPYERRHIAAHLRYAEDVELRLLLPCHLDSQVADIVTPIRDRPIEDVQDLLRRIQRLERLGHDVTIYPDAEEHIDRLLVRQRLETTTREVRKNPENHVLRRTLLKVDLLPYQLDGIGFAVGAGRAILADDMGLGKTIQGIGVAQLLANELGISRVLVICPASVKSQWRIEINRATALTCQLVVGNAEDRVRQYETGAFFTICNYEQVLRDIVTIEKLKWDLIILDEGQRIKNWQAKTTQTVKSLRSPYALVLSGTPLENRLDELYSVVQFIDAWRLGPAFRFFSRHRVVDEKGKLLGYRNLDDLRRRLKGILLRRTRSMVMSDLPPRTTETLRIPPTEEQAQIHAGQKRIISTILAKKYLSEMDLLRLQKALLLCRLVADSTYLVDKEAPGYSSKLKELEYLLGELLAEEDRKIILFSEWTTMLDLIQPLLDANGAKYIRLDGSVPQRKRQGLMRSFQTDPEYRLFITTNAGATGLNLQAANTVVNVDLPWNPAILEQRISRAHRMGQKRPVHVYLLVTEETLEESLLTTLAAKQDLALAALDAESDVTELAFSGNIEELKRRLEVLLGAKPEAPIDESRKAEVEREAALQAKRHSIAKAGGQLFSAAFSFIGKLVEQTGPPNDQQDPAQDPAVKQFESILSECMERKEDGRLQMTIEFPDESAINNLAKTLGALTKTVQKG